jgi:putative ABC transport system substrate-binding protein
MWKKRLLILTLLSFSAFTAQILAAGEKNLKIALVTWRGETDAEKGFKDGLKELGYGVDYQEFNAQQDMTKLSTILKTQLDPKQFDYLYTFGTSASVRVSKEYNEETPQIFNIVSFPVESGLVQSLEMPIRNISGASNYVPIDKQVEILHNVLKVKKLGVLYNPREKNSEIALQTVQSLAAKYGYSVEAYRIAPETETLNEFVKGLESGQITADAFHLMPDSFITSQAQVITDALTKAKIPSFTAIEEIVKKKGGLMGLVPSYYELGKAAASILDQHQKGKPMSEIPVVQQSSLTLVINKKTAETLGVQFDPATIQGAQWIE